MPRPFSKVGDLINALALCVGVTYVLDFLLVYGFFLNQARSGSLSESRITQYYSCHDSCFSLG